MTALARGRHARRPDWPRVRLPFLIAADICLFYVGWFTHSRQVVPLVVAAVLLVFVRCVAIR